MARWPDVYAQGGRKRELMRLISEVVKNSLLVFCVMFFVISANGVECVQLGAKENFEPKALDNTRDEAGVDLFNKVFETAVSPLTAPLVKKDGRALC